MPDIANFSVSETLRDGTRLEIRSLRRGDRDALLAAVRAMSDNSIYRRFFTFKRVFSDQETSKFVNIDFRNHVALVAVTVDRPGDIVAGARYVLIAPAKAEFACAVVDKFQKRGLGRLVFSHLCALATQQGIRTLVAEVLPENEAMLKVFGSSGFPMQVQRSRDAVHVVIELPPSDTAPGERDFHRQGQHYLNRP
jgi:RimJ/RimL family protein N-acetyltransferase